MTARTRPWYFERDRVQRAREGQARRSAARNCTWMTLPGPRCLAPLVQPELSLPSGQRATSRSQSTLKSLKPSLLILVAPFAAGCSAYTVAVGQADLFAGALYMPMLFVLAVLPGQLRHSAACRPFRVSWWAVSFPFAAASIAALHFAAAQPGPVTDAIASVPLAPTTPVIAALLGRTVLGLLKGELRSLST